MEQNPEHIALEKDIERLAGEVRERGGVATPESKKEAIKQVIGEKIYPEGLPSQGAGAPPAAVLSSPILPNYLQNADPSVKLQVEKLVDLAWHKGVGAAVKEAKKSGALYIDAFHDAITDKLYAEFKKRGLL